MGASWQTDLLNIALQLSVKPALRFATSVEQVRAIAGFGDRFGGRLAMPRGTVRRPVRIPRSQCDAEWVLRGPRRGRHVVLYLPGGAYVMRTPNLHSAMVSRLCRASDTSALMLYYRLAPEHPFPACLEDSVRAYRWLLDQDIAPERIVIAGDSAGGGLTLSTLLAIRNEGLPVPAGGVMYSPLLDVSDRSASRWKNADSDKALPHPRSRGINPRLLYMGEFDARDERVSPLYGDFSGLPPLYFLVGDGELLLDDSLRAAWRARIFNVRTRVEVWPKVPHVWPLFTFLPEASQAIEQTADFIRDSFRRTETTAHVSAAAQEVAA